MPQTPELDPVTVRKLLVVHRQKGTPWEAAWLAATGHHRPSTDDRSVYKFMRDAFEAAYHNDGTGRGRCLVPERDVSGAIVAGILRVPKSHGRCRSGDRCQKPATHGRLGHFCEQHAVELARIADEFWGARRRAQPRVNGNTSLYTHRAA